MREPANVPDARSGGREKQRSRTGCRTCRSRKVKCDERPGGCHNCARLNLPCPNSPAYREAVRPGGHEGEFLRTQAGLRRSRTYRSCRSCRSSKSRCSGERPACLRCRERKVDCSYDGKQAPAWLEAASREAEKRVESRGETPSSSAAGYSLPSSPELPQVGSQGMGSRGRTTSCERETDPFSWLTSPELPRGQDRARELVEAFFVHIHSLRSFGFVHKPTVMQQLGGWARAWHDHQNNALLLVICALGAKFCALRYCDDAQLAGGRALSAGSQWACRAHQLVAPGPGRAPSVEAAMAVVLLHEHELRVGHHANAFVLTGLGVRMARALQIHLEPPAGVPAGAAAREARRRLMWSVYIMDSWVGSGVDELTLVDEADVRVQLPCSDRTFDLQEHSIVETLYPGAHLLPYLPAGGRMKGPVESLDLHGYFIRLVSLRRKVLRYVKHLDQARTPWSTASEFAVLQSRLRLWLDNLPESLRFTRDAIHTRKEASQLGGLLFCHFTYHQTMCDLTRIGMQDLFKTRARVKYPAEQADFLTRVQDHCFEHCMALCALYEEAMRHGPEALADTWLSVVAYDSARVIVHYISRGLGTSQQKGETLKTHAVAAVHSNIRALKSMIPLHSLARSLYSAAVKLLARHDLPIPHSTDRRSPPPLIIFENEEAPEIDLSSPAQYTPEYVLSPLAIFRMARRDMVDRGKHHAETSAFPRGSTTPEMHPDSGRVSPGVLRAGVSGSGLVPSGSMMPLSSGLDVPFRPAALQSPPLPSSFSTPATGSPAAVPPTVLVEGGLDLGGAYGGTGVVAGGASHLRPRSQLASTLDDLQMYMPMMTTSDMGAVPAHQTGFPVVDVPPPAGLSSAFPGYSPPPPVCHGGVVDGFDGWSAGSGEPYQENIGHVMGWAVYN